MSQPTPRRTPLQPRAGTNISRPGTKSSSSHASSHGPPERERSELSKKRKGTDHEKDSGSSAVNSNASTSLQVPEGKKRKHNQLADVLNPSATMDIDHDEGRESTSVTPHATAKQVTLPPTPVTQKGSKSGSPARATETPLSRKTISSTSTSLEPNESSAGATIGVLGDLPSVKKPRKKGAVTSVAAMLKELDTGAIPIRPAWSTGGPRAKGVNAKEKVANGFSKDTFAARKAMFAAQDDEEIERIRKDIEGKSTGPGTLRWRHSIKMCYAAYVIAKKGRTEEDV
ncbi:hypothetical protein HK097_003582 [Rhizophlyctis rosea]|uniref:Uncharacterized protein n=1 Tax=Rhizophlyctis rosea TaxID=64517 RepID=A0AAD5S2G3_9FUNG|nr:hypothetical protein HK097_003582 [Rhizophlyctis rosea]